jgi:hypothetical protein
MMMRCTCLQNNKTNGSKLLFLESAHLDRRMHESRRSTTTIQIRPTNKPLTHSLSPRFPFQKKEPRSTAKRILLMHRTEPLSLIRNDRKIRAEKDQITSNTSGNFPRLPQPPPQLQLQSRTCRDATKGGPSLLRYSNEQTCLDHDGQLTNRTRGRGIKTLRCGFEGTMRDFFGALAFADGGKGVCWVNAAGVGCL